MRRRLVHWLVRMYPLAWRERYQFEFLGLFDDAEPSWSDVGDIARTMIRERAKSAFQSVFGQTDSRLRVLRLRHLGAMTASIALGVAIGSISAAAASLLVVPSKSWAVSSSTLYLLNFLPLARVMFAFIGAGLLNWPSSFNLRFSVGRAELIAWIIFISGVTLAVACANVAHGPTSLWEHVADPGIPIMMLVLATKKRLADQVELKRLRLEKVREDARAHFKFL